MDAGAEGNDSKNSDCDDDYYTNKEQPTDVIVVVVVELVQKLSCLPTRTNDADLGDLRGMLTRFSLLLLNNGVTRPLESFFIRADQIISEVS